MNQPKKPGNRFEELQSSGTATPNSVSLNGNTPRSVSPVTVPVTIDSNLLDTFDDVLNEIKSRILVGIPGIGFVSILETYEKILKCTSTLNDEVLQKRTLKPIKFDMLKVLAADKEKSSKETIAPQEQELHVPSPAPPAPAAPAEPSVPIEDLPFTKVDRKKQKKEKKLAMKSESMAALDAFPTQQASSASSGKPTPSAKDSLTSDKIATSGTKEVNVDYKDVYGTNKSELKPGHNPISKQSSSAGQRTGRPISPLTSNPLANRNNRDKPSGSVSTNNNEKQDDSDEVKSIDFPRLVKKAQPTPASTITLKPAPTPAPSPTLTPAAAGPVKPEPTPVSTSPVPEPVPTTPSTIPVPIPAPGQLRLDLPHEKGSMSDLVQHNDNPAKCCPILDEAKLPTLVPSTAPVSAAPTLLLTAAGPAAVEPPPATPVPDAPTPMPGETLALSSLVSTPSTISVSAPAPVEPASTTMHKLPEIQKKSVPAIIAESGSTTVPTPSLPSAPPAVNGPLKSKKQRKKQSSAPVAPPIAKEPLVKPVKPAPVPKVKEKPPTVTSLDSPKSAPTYPTMKSLDEGMTEKGGNTSKSAGVSLRQCQVEEKKRHIAALNARLTMETEKLNRLLPINAVGSERDDCGPANVYTLPPRLDFSNLLIEPAHSATDQFQDRFLDDKSRSAQMIASYLADQRQTVLMTRTRQRALEAEETQALLASASHRSPAPSHSNPLRRLMSGVRSALSPMSSAQIMSSSSLNALHSNRLGRGDGPEDDSPEDSSSSATPSSSSPSTPVASTPSSSTPSASVTPRQGDRPEVSPTRLFGEAVTQQTPTMMNTFMQNQIADTFNSANPLFSSLRGFGRSTMNNLPTIPASLFPSMSGMQNPPTSRTGGGAPSPPPVTIYGSSSTAQSSTESQAKTQQISEDENLSWRIISEQFDQFLEQSSSTAKESESKIEQYQLLIQQLSTKLDESLKESNKQSKDIAHQKKELDDLRNRIDGDPSQSPDPYGECYKGDSGDVRKDKSVSNSNDKDSRRRSRLDSLTPSMQRKTITLGSHSFRNPHFKGGGDGGDGDGPDDDDGGDDPPQKLFKYDPDEFPHRNPLFILNKAIGDYEYDFVHWMSPSIIAAQAFCVNIRMEIDSRGNRIRTGMSVVHAATDTTDLTYKSPFNGDRYSTVINREQKHMLSPVMSYRYLTQSLFQTLGIGTWRHLAKSVVNVAPVILDMLNPECKSQFIDTLNLINRLSQEDGYKHLYDGLVITGRPESAETLQSNKWDHCLCKMWVVINFVDDDQNFDLKLKKKLNLWFKHLPVLPKDSLKMWKSYPDWHLLLVDMSVDLMHSLIGLRFTAQKPIFLQHTKQSRRGPYGFHNLFMELMKSKNSETLMLKWVATFEYGGEVLFDDQKPVKAKNEKDYIVAILIESQLASDATHKTRRLMNIFEQQSNDSNSDLKSKSTSMSVRDSSPMKSHNFSSQKKNSPVSDNRKPLPDHHRSVFARKRSEPNKLLYIDAHTLNNMSTYEKFEYLDEDQEEETLNHLMNLNLVTRNGPLHSFVGADKSAKGERTNSVCLMLLHRGWCKQGDKCNFNHDRKALLQGREDAKKLWEKDIELNHLLYNWTEVEDHQYVSTADRTLVESTETEDAEDTEEVASPSWYTFNGDGVDSQ